MPPREQLANGVFELEQAFDEEHRKRLPLQHYRRVVTDALDA